ncbi:MAG: phosphoenolpyruvate carboxykinase [Actinomycetia bacterium]|nr:phosphoenolpyruvate carboxykinase [Actinomycetes bacterium]
MGIYSYSISGKKVIIKIRRRICETPEELLESELFVEIVNRCINHLKRHNSPLLAIFKDKKIDEGMAESLAGALKLLAGLPASLLLEMDRKYSIFIQDPKLLYDFVEYLYNYWRNFERFIICTSDIEALDKRPYRTFNQTVEKLTHLIRGTYRDLQENISGKHPRVYRQVRAGSEVAAIAQPKDIGLPGGLYQKLEGIPVIRQALIYLPLVLNPPMNKRTGSFQKIETNPLQNIEINQDEWIVYPARVGPLNIHIFIHRNFLELGFSLANLFELIDDHKLNQKPDAVYLFGVDEQQISGLAEFPTVFYDDKDNHIMVAAVPNSDRFGYFGYLKKMVLTLHNIIMMKKGRWPFHGALVNIMLNDGSSATILLVGDSGAGKSETLEALRILGDEHIREMTIIADDMGSVELSPEGILGYGTEIGAFLRLDDLQPGYAFGQIDRAIIMSPSMTNARIVLPVTSIDTVLKGWNIDLILYANNYENVDADHPVIEINDNYLDALRIFREGTVMSKGTTTSTGLTHSYFANIFGPQQYKKLHQEIAEKYFKSFYQKSIRVGQIRTRLGIEGLETEGPRAAATRLLEIISE